MEYFKVKNEQSLVRDAKSTAILNTDNETLRAYKMRKQRESLIETVMQEQTEIRKEMSEIKQLLVQLIGKS